MLISGCSSVVSTRGTRGLIDDLGVRLFDFSVESIVVVTLTEVELEDFSDLRLLPRSVTGEIDVAGAAVITLSPKGLKRLGPAVAASFDGLNSSLYR